MQNLSAVAHADFGITQVPLSVSFVVVAEKASFPGNGARGLWEL
jgi:hypothetical protein